MQKIELLLKNSLSLLLLIISLNLYASKNISVLKRDTTLILAFEVCSDSTIFNCWAINQGDYNLSGLIFFDTVTYNVKIENGYFIYQSQYLNSNVVDSLVYLQFKAYRQDYSALYWGNNVQIPFDSTLRSKFSPTNLLQVKDDKLTKILKKEKCRTKILNEYAQPNNIISSSYKITGHRMYYLFKLTIEFQPSDRYFSDRIIVDSKGKIRRTKVPYYYITKVISLEPYNSKRNELKRK